MKELIKVSKEIDDLQLRSSGVEINEIDSAARLTKTIRDLYDDISALRKRIGYINTHMKTEVMPRLFDEKGVSSITIDGYRFTKSETIRASIIKDQKMEAYEWLRENDLGDLITETVNASTLAAAAKHQLEIGYELSQDYFAVYHQPNLSITKAK